MTDTIATRVSRIVSGSVHALLDAVESAAPEAVMAQAIREVEEAAGDVRVELGRAAANKHLATSRLVELNRRHGELGDQIEVALGAGRDDLAEAAVARQLDIEAQIPVVEHAVADAADEEKRLEGYLAALNAKRRDMDAALNEFIASRQTSAGASALGSPGKDTTAGKLDRASAAFDRVMARETGLAGPPGVAAQDAAKLAQLNALARQNRVAERLAALKAKRSD